MAATTQLLPTGPQAATSAHLRPLDSVLNALEDMRCTWCAGLLQLLHEHLEHNIQIDGRAN